LADRGLLRQLGLGDLLRHLLRLVLERKVFRVRKKAKETMNRSTVDIDSGHARRGSELVLFRATFEVLANAMDDFGLARSTRTRQKKRATLHRQLQSSTLQCVKAIKVIIGIFHGKKYLKKKVTIQVQDSNLDMQQMARVKGEPVKHLGRTIRDAPEYRLPRRESSVERSTRLDREALEWRRAKVQRQ